MDELELNFNIDFQTDFNIDIKIDNLLARLGLVIQKDN